MSSSTATRTGRLAQPAPPMARATASRRTLSGPGCSVGGRAERPVLRIVSEGECAPVFTRVLPDVLVEPVEVVSTRRVRLDDFFVAEYDGDDQAVQFAAPRSAIRLTRRGRLVVFGAAVAAVLGFGLLAASGSLASSHSERTHVVTVQPGQTLWDISARAADGGDVRSMMSHVESLNHLDSASLQTGQTLRVPTR